MGYIYKITNTLNGKAYIGQTVKKVEYRINQHFNRSSCPVLRNAIEKYGRDAFRVEILHEVLDIFMDDLETAEIKKHNTLSPNGYNLEGGGHANKTRSPEIGQKISAAKKGKTLSLEHRQKLSESHKGKSLSPETRKKISDAHKGKIKSPETRKKLSNRRLSPESRKKMSDAATGRRHSPETRKKLSDRRRSPEYRRKMSEVNAHPDRPTAFQILNSLPANMPLTKRRRILQNKFPEIDRGVIHSWVKKWKETTSSSCAPSDRHIAFQILNALPENMPLKEKYKHLRDKFPERPRGTIHGWVRKWSKTSP